MSWESDRIDSNIESCLSDIEEIEGYIKTQMAKGYVPTVILFALSDKITVLKDRIAMYNEMD